jgi:nucleoside triphosphate pyrophosphatase
MSDIRRLVLASASPARRATLRAAGLFPEVMVSDVDESAYTADTPAELAQLLATAKASAVAALSVAEDALVVGCDSVLDLDGSAMGKPVDSAEAVRRWRAMRGRQGTLVTGHCVIDTRIGKQVEATSATKVTFADLTDEEIDAYVATGEPLNVAGAFTIDGLGGPFVTSLSGDHHTVVGISLPLLRTMLRDLDITWTSLWK